jgi:hypothetical protein
MYIGPDVLSVVLQGFGFQIANVLVNLTTSDEAKIQTESINTGRLFILWGQVNPQFSRRAYGPLQEESEYVDHVHSDVPYLMRSGYVFTPYQRYIDLSFM